MTATERLILENQKLILHGLRALLWDKGIGGPAQEMQDAMERTHDYLWKEKQQCHTNIDTQCGA